MTFLSDEVYLLKTKTVSALNHARVHFDWAESSFYITEGMYTLPETMTGKEFLVRRKMLTESEEDFYSDFWDDSDIETYMTDEEFVFEKWTIEKIELYVPEPMDMKKIIDML